MKNSFSKKALSLFMAVLMVMSSWVFFAPMKAEAAAGGYYVRVNWTCVDNGNDYDRDYDGFDNKADDNCVGISIFYKDNNGLDSVEKEKYWNLRSEMDQGSNKNYTTTSQYMGFPTYIYIYNDHGGITDEAKLNIYEIQISADNSTWETLWAGQLQLDSTNQIKYAKYDVNGDIWRSSNVTYSTTTDNWEYPYAETFTWSDPKGMTCPATNSTTATQQISVTAKDQYGVQMFDPTWTVSDNNSSSSGMTVTDGATATPTITVPYSMNIAGTTNTQTGTVTATWVGAAQTKTSSKTFTITDAQYTATFTNLKDATGGSLADITRTGIYYGCLPTEPSTTEFPRMHSIGDNDFKFTAWSPVIPTAGLTANSTFTAQYDDGTFMPADYTEVINQIQRADTFRNKDDYERRYNEKAIEALETAIAKANVGVKLGRTQQDVVDGYAAAIKAANDFMETPEALSVHDVIFLNEDTLLKIDSNIKYEYPATAPATDGLVKAPDEYGHYTFKGWDKDFSSVTENMLVYAEYNTHPHDWDNGTPVVKANCLHGEGTKFTCTVCYYERYEETAPADPDAHEESAKYLVDTEATCTTAGAGHYYCTVCGATTREVVIPAKGHTYQSTVTKPATCTETGERVFTCTDCAHENKEEIPLVQHAFTEGTPVAPTCTSSGYTPLKCDNCPLTYKIYNAGQPAKAHSFTKWTYDSTGDTAVVASSTCDYDNCNATVSVSVDKRDVQSIVVTAQPTCKAPGSATVTYDDGKTAVVDIEANPKAHANYSTAYVPAECDKAGSVTVTCADCGTQISKTDIAALKHSYSDWNVTTEATCEGTGSKTRTCASCNDVQTETIPALGHKTVEVPADCTKAGYTKCAVCGINIATVAKTEHVFTNGEVKLEIPAICTKDGYKIVACENCEAVKIEKLTNKPPHNYEVKYERPADCFSNSIKLFVCSICGDVKTEEGNDKLEHAFTVPVPEMSFDPTCEGKGVTMMQCANGCGHYKQTIIPANGHTPEKLSAVEPTCTATGLTEGSICSVCDKLITAQTVVPATGHSAELKWEEKTPATCTSAGYKVGKCKVCDTIVETESIPASGHDFPETWTEVTAPTCTTYGTEERACQNNCGTKETKVVSALGHDMVAGSKVETTCYSSAYTPYDCSRCEHNYNVYEGDTLKEHTYTWTPVRNGDEITVTGECSANGCGYKTSFKFTDAQRDVKSVELITAAKCNAEGTVKVTLDDNTEETYNIPVNADAHALVSTRTEPSCETTGSIVTTCQNGCTYSKNETMPALGHSYGEAVVTQATCKIEGKAVFTCIRDNCGKTIEAIIPVNENHTWGAWSVTKAATETENGEMQRTCSICNDTETATIPAGGHTFDMEGEPVESEASTCTKAGYEVYACTVHTGENSCGQTLRIDLPLAAHTVALKKSTAPSCTTEGEVMAYCSKCQVDLGAVEKIAALGHDFVKDGDPKPADCTTDGSQTWKCSRCNETKTEVLPKLGHSMKAGDRVEATCTTGAYVPYTCENNCGHTYNIYDNDDPAKAHTFTKWTYTDNADGTAVVATSKCDDCDATVSVSVDKRDVKSIVITSQPTCQSKGSATVTYDDGKTVTVEIDVNPNAHNIITTVTQATCEKAGSVVTECINEGCTLEKKTQEIPQLKHSYKPSVTKEPTCTEEGVRTYTCENCKDSYTETIAKLQHAYGEAVLTEGTCTSNAYNTYTCTNDKCSSSYVEIIPDSVKAHAYEKLNTSTEPTCTTAGHYYFDCKNCDAAYDYEVVAKGHAYKSSVTQQQSCTDVEITTYTCETANCGYSYTAITKAPLGHDWNKWTVDKAATDTVEGSMTRTCKRSTSCTETIIIPATGGHEWNEGEVITPASCTEAGEMKFTCIKENCQICKAEGDTPATRTQAIPAKGHTEELIVENATCTTAGIAKIVCTVESCKAVIESKDIPAKGHNFANAEITKPATCKEKGEITMTCACGEKTTSEIAVNANAHTYVAGTKVEATCTRKAYVPYTCEYCGDSYIVEVGELAEHTTEKRTVVATCTADGFEESYCTACNKIVETKVLNKTGHAWDEWTTEGEDTCTTAALRKRVCKNDTAHVESEVVDTVKHDYTETNVEADCTHGAYTVKTCKNCDDTYNVYSADSKTAPHDYYKLSEVKNGDKITVTLRCNTCKDEKYDVTFEIDATKTVKSVSIIAQPTCRNTGKATVTYTNDTTEEITLPVNSEAHTIITTVTDAKCTATGKVVNSCACGYTEDVKILGELGHLYGAPVVVDATCNAKGSATVTCTRTDCTATLVTEIAMNKSHVWGAWSETTPGKLTRECTVCDATDSVDIPSGGHKYDTTGDPIVVTDATCTAEGTGKFVCTQHTGADACGVDLNVKIPAKGHRDITVAIAVAPTCTEKGVASATCKYCSVIGSTEIAPLGHDLVLKSSQAADCTTDGTEYYECSRAGCDEKKEVAIPKLGHNMVGETPVPATCTNSGYTVFKCNNSGCQHTYTVYNADRKEHDWNAWSVITPATDTTDGEQERTCKNCSAKETAPVPATRHNAVENTALYEEPSCTAEGKRVYECTLTHPGETEECGYSYEVIIPKLGHNYKTEYKLPNCTENGYIITECDREGCGNKLTDVVLAAPGHKEYDLPAVAATCTETGLTAGKKCAVCGEETLKQTVTKALGHTEEILPAVDATCTSTGLTEGKKCSVCDAILTAQTVTEKLNHTEEILEAVEPGCTTTGLTEGKKCSVCHEILVAQTSVAATDHKYIFAAENQATCSAQGSLSLECENCGDVITEKTATNENHTWGEWEVSKAATNTEKGEMKRTCQLNEKHVQTVEIPAGGHTFNMAKPTSSVEATCHSKGSATYACTAHTGDKDCGISLTVETEPVQHTDVAIEVVAEATCETKGEIRAYCKAEGCGATLATVETETIEHNFNVRVEASSFEATCYSEGEILWKCATCEETKLEKLPMKAHSITTTPVDATCLTPAYKVHDCINDGCGYLVNEYNGTSAKGHSFPDTWTVIEHPTAEKQGKQQRQCADCDAIETVILPALGHAMIKGEYKAPTCTEKGYQIYVCATHTGAAACGYSYTEVIAEAQHTLTTVKVDPTCADDGYVRTFCTKCDTVNIETTLDNRGHKAVELIEGEEPTCTESGFTTGVKCVACGEILLEREVIAATGHSMVSKVVAPTCTEKGYTENSCTKCVYGTFTDYVDAKGHNYGKPVFYWNEAGTVADAEIRCLNDANHTKSLSVTMTFESDAASCLYKGTTTYMATAVSVDGKTYTDTNVVIGSLGEHKLIRVERVEPTCEADGNKEYFKCEICYKYYEDINGTKEISRESVILPAGHKVVVDSYKAPTCTETGLTEGSHCSVCGEILVEQTVIEALGHTAVAVEAKAPTCTDSGYTAGEKCSVCGEVLSGITEIPATGHTETIIPGKDSTCTEDGYTDKTICSVCGDILVNSEPIPMKGHDMSEITVIKAASCTEKGETRYDCSRCDYYYTEETEINPYAHNWSEWTNGDGTHMRYCLNDVTHTVESGTCSDSRPELIPATCKEFSYYLHVCEVCGYKWQTPSGDTTLVGHSFTKFYSNNDATCTENATQFAYCDYGCGEIHTEEIPDSANGHVWSEWRVSVPAMCGNYEIEERICVYCGDKQTREDISSGKGSHTLIVIEGHAPTCTSEGSTDYMRCVKCGYYTESVILPKLEHVDKDKNQKCDLCDGLYVTDDNSGETKLCGCMCHKESGFIKFIYSIISFFWKLFGSNETCECGAVHY